VEHAQLNLVPLVESDTNETTDNQPRSIKDWQFYNLKHAYQHRDPIQYAIRGLFALPSLNIVYGPPGCLKSLLLADAAVSVASGQTWLPRMEREAEARFPVQQPGPVVWIDLDNGTRHTHERFGALARERGLPPDTPLYYISIPTPYPNASSRKHIDDLIEMLKPVQPHLVVIDNLGTVSGGIDENSSAMIDVMANLRTLAEQTGAAVIVIHHSRKAKADHSAARLGDMLRGHSSIEASLDLALEVDRHGALDVVTVRSTKERGPKVDPFGALLEYTHIPDTDDLATARFWGCDPKNDPKTQKIVNAIWQELRNGPIEGKTKFEGNINAKLKGIGIKSIQPVIELLVREGKLVHEKLSGERKTNQYSLAPGQWSEMHDES